VINIFTQEVLLFITDHTTPQCVATQNVIANSWQTNTYIHTYIHIWLMINRKRV